MDTFLRLLVALTLISCLSNLPMTRIKFSCSDHLNLLSLSGHWDLFHGYLPLLFTHTINISQKFLLQLAFYSDSFLRRERATKIKMNFFYDIFYSSKYKWQEQEKNGLLLKKSYPGLKNKGCVGKSVSF